jgi:MFS family permease
MSDVTRTPPGNDVPTAELLRQLSEQMSTLVSQEIALAKAEVSEKGKKAGIGAGMFGGAGVIGFYLVGTLLATIILALVEAGIVAWLSALIVTVVLGAIAAVLALSGKKQIDAATPPAPEKTIASVKRDTDTIKTSAQAGRNAR